MKHSILVILFTGIAFLAAGCQKPAATKTASAAGVVTAKQYGKLEEQVNRLTTEVDHLQQYANSRPDFYLWAMDHDLAAAERGTIPYGSFTDYFVPNARNALQFGATRRAVEKRIDKLIVLAKKKVYISSYEARLGSPAAIRAYVERQISQ